jgi:ribonuclease D
MLNWRRDPGYEQRMKQLRSETEQLRSETEQLRRENAKQRALSALIRQHCFPDESNSTPLPPTEPDSGSS